MDYTLFAEASVVSAIFLVVFHILRKGFIFENPYVQVALTGFIGHLLCEAVQLNKYYCTNGHACKN